MNNYSRVLIGVALAAPMVFANEIKPSELQMKNVTIPKTVAGNKSPTVNGTGYVFYTITPVGEEFLKNECVAAKTVIDIGAGYSNVPIEAIQRGVGKYVVNDIAIEHMQILVHKATKVLGNKKLDNLVLVHGRAPAILPDVQHEYDAILADKVIHFMQPVEILEFITWAKKALKPQGKIYVTTASPYSYRYRNLLHRYLDKLQRGEQFPGHFTNMQQFIDIIPLENYSDYVIPSEMTLFSRHDLIKLFESQGMRVIDSYSLKLPSDDEPNWKTVADAEGNLVGIIASF